MGAHDHRDVNPQRSLATQKILELNEKIAALDKRIRSQGLAFATEKDVGTSRVLKAEIQELTKRRKHLVGLRDNLQHQDTSQFSEFADFKYGHLTAEENQAIVDLGSLLDLSDDELKQNYPAFTRVMAHTEKRGVLLHAISKQKQREDRMLALEKELKDQAKTLRKLRNKHASKTAAAEALKAEVEESQQRVFTLDAELCELRERAAASQQEAEVRYEEQVGVNHALREEAIEYRREFEDAQAELRDLGNQSNNVAAELETARQALADHVEQSDRALAEASQETTQWKETSQACTQKREQLEASEKALQTAIADLKTQLDRQAETLAQQEHQLREGETREHEFGLEQARLESELAHLHQQLERKEATREFHLGQIMDIYRLHRQQWHEQARPILKTSQEFDYGYLVAFVWLEVNQGKTKSAAVFEERVKALLADQDWQARFCSESKKGSVREAHDFQIDRLVFEDTVTLSPAENYPDLYENILGFSVQSQAWREAFEYEEFLAGRHPQHDQVWRLLGRMELSVEDVSKEKFIELSERYLHQLQDVDKQEEDGVE